MCRGRRGRGSWRSTSGLTRGMSGGCGGCTRRRRCGAAARRSAPISDLCLWQPSRTTSRSRSPTITSSPSGPRPSRAVLPRQRRAMWLSRVWMASSAAGFAGPRGADGCGQTRSLRSASAWSGTRSCARLARGWSWRSARTTGSDRWCFCALERNATDGHAGRLVSFDVNPTAGWLVGSHPLWDLRIESSHDGLPGLLNPDGELDMLIYDGWHAYDAEHADLDYALQRLSPDGLLISDDAQTTYALADLCQASELTYLEFHEIPVRHFHPGATLGAGRPPTPDEARRAETGPAPEDMPHPVRAAQLGTPSRRPSRRGRSTSPDRSRRQRGSRGRRFRTGSRSGRAAKRLRACSAPGRAAREGRLMATRARGRSRRRTRARASWRS